jgi:uncharacterized protein (DUF302 family)
MDMLHVKECDDSLEVVGARLEQAAQAHKFGVINIVDLKAKMASKGVEFGPECRVYEVCNPQRAKEVLESNLGISTALPCRISLYEENGKTKLATMLPTQVLGMFGEEDLKSVAESVEADIKAMMDEASTV